MNVFTLFLCYIITCLTLSYAYQQQDDLKNIELSALEFILSPETLRMYQELSNYEKKTWADRFWRAMDPTPTTTMNEYYEEFYKRFMYAYKNFHNLTTPYYLDDRAKYYLKYGPPDDHVQLVGSGKFYKDNITWVYYDLNLFIDFVDSPFYGYREVLDLSEAVSSAPGNEKARVLKELYLERTDLSQKYIKFRNIRNDLDYYSEIQEIIQEKTLALEKAPPSIYHFEHDVEPLTIRLASCLFKENKNQNLSRLELYYSVPLRELVYKTSDSNFLVTHLNKHVIIYDENYQQEFQLLI